MSTVFGRLSMSSLLVGKRHVHTVTTDTRVVCVGGVGAQVCVWVVRDDQAPVVPAQLVLWLFGDGEKVEVPGAGDLDYLGTAVVSAGGGAQKALHVFSHRPPVGREAPGQKVN